MVAEDWSLSSDLFIRLFFFLFERKIELLGDSSDMAAATASRFSCLITSLIGMATSLGCGRLGNLAL
jgi:hypothetical protein